MHHRGDQHLVGRRPGSGERHDQRHVDRRPARRHEHRDRHSTCTAALPTGESCTITTTRAVLEDDPSPLENTVTVNYNPDGLPQRHHCVGLRQCGHRGYDHHDDDGSPDHAAAAPAPARPLPQTGANLDAATMAGIAALFAGCIALVAARKLRAPAGHGPDRAPSRLVVSSGFLITRGRPPLTPVTVGALR